MDKLNGTYSCFQAWVEAWIKHVANSQALNGALAAGGQDSHLTRSGTLDVCQKEHPPVYFDRRYQCPFCFTAGPVMNSSRKQALAAYLASKGTFRAVFRFSERRTYFRQNFMDYLSVN